MCSKVTEAQTHETTLAELREEVRKLTQTGNLALDQWEKSGINLKI